MSKQRHFGPGFDIVTAQNQKKQLINLKKIYSRKRRFWSLFFFLVGIFLTVTTLLGGFYFWVSNKDGYTTIFNYVKNKTAPPLDLKNGPIAPSENFYTESTNTNEFLEKTFNLEIKTADLNINTPVWQGVGEEILSKGVGLQPGTALPGFSGNTVIYGHRWYPGDNPFFTIFNDLDKLKIGDTATIFYNNEKFTYQVIEGKVVEPNQVEILEQTEAPILTIYTCTPRYTAEKRLVYIFRLIKWEK